MTAPPKPLLALVLDTNIVLDWLVFDDPGVEALRKGLRDSRLAIVTSPPALDELRRVLAYPQLKLDTVKQEAVFNTYRACAIDGALPAEFSRENLLLPQGFPRCRDRDDDHFLALAYHARADALVSKDKALLKLAKRVKSYGLTILDAARLGEMALPPLLG